MKKILLSMVCLMTMGMQSVKAQVGIAALHHAGNVAVFGEDKVANAIAAAVEGDTIYLSEGHFLGNITIDKPIHVIGSGHGTIVDGDVTISIDNTPTLTGYMLVGMHIIGDIIPNKSLNGLRISQCYFKDYGRSKSGSASDRITVTDLYVERSYCTNLFYVNEVESGNVYSSKIKSLYCQSPTGRSSFNHCNISNDLNNGDIGYFAINCLFGTSTSKSNSYQNCFINNSSTVSTEENCWHQSTSNNFFDDELNCSFTDEDLRTNGYIATDGTVVGITGGDAPYTLSLATPKVLEHNIVVDKETKKLNVTLRVGNE